jgi:hypothetical protein
VFYLAAGLTAKVPIIKPVIIVVIIIIIIIIINTSLLTAAPITSLLLTL